MMFWTQKTTLHPAPVHVFAGFQSSKCVAQTLSFSLADLPVVQVTYLSNNPSNWNHQALSCISPKSAIITWLYGISSYLAWLETEFHVKIAASPSWEFLYLQHIEMSKHFSWLTKSRFTWLQVNMYQPLSDGFWPQFPTQKHHKTMQFFPTRLRVAPTAPSNGFCLTLNLTWFKLSNRQLSYFGWWQP